MSWITKFYTDKSLIGYAHAYETEWISQGPQETDRIEISELLHRHGASNLRVDPTRETLEAAALILRCTDTPVFRETT